MTVNRVTNLGVEVFGVADPKERVTNLGAEVLGVADPKARVTNLGSEVLGYSDPNARITNLAIEIFGVLGAPVPGNPEKPTISIADTGPDYINLTGSTYVPGPLGDPHANSQWQVTLSTDTGFATPIIDTLVSLAPLETFYAQAGLNLFLNQYISRVRYQNEYGNWSEWSDATAATGIVAEGQFYTAMAERPIGTDPRTDPVADWDELDISDGQSTWPITSRIGATCDVVSRRGSVDGAVDTVDPLYWQGFPNVDEQIVFARVIFDGGGTGGDSCVGESDPTGLICKEHSGLVEFADFESDAIDTVPDGWRVVSGGTSVDDDDAGWRVVAGDGHYYDSPPTYGNTYTKCLRFNKKIAYPKIADFAHIIWETPGELSEDYVVQGWMRLGFLGEEDVPWWENGFPGVVSGHQINTPQIADFPYFIGRNEHLCGLLRTWVFNQGVWGNSYVEWIFGTLNYSWGGGWEALKLYAKRGEQSLWRGRAAHWELPSETRHAEDPLTDHTGVGFVGFNAGYCLSAFLESYIEFNELSVCEANWVKILDAPAGMRIDLNAHTSGQRLLSPVSGTGLDYFDFGAIPFPGDKLTVYAPDGTLLTTFEPTDQIWGGDIYRIRFGGIGVGRIGGAAARLTGTPEGTDGSGYLAYLDDGRFLRLEKWSAAGGLVNLGSYSFEHEANKYYNIVLEATGTTVRAKVWEGGAGLQGDPENNDPLVWHISVTDATYATGAPGVVALDATDVDFDVFATGLGGQAYPTGRYPGACTWVQPTGDVQVDPVNNMIDLEWTAPPVIAGVLGGELVYELQYQQNGASSWSPLASNLRETTYSWDVSRFTQTNDYCVQVRAYAGCEYGPWTPVCFQWVGADVIYRVPDGYFFGDWYTGETDVGMWIRLFEASHTDDGLPVSGCLVTRELMPAGVGGECLFQKLYVTLTFHTVGVMYVTPILDGEYLVEERRAINFGDFDPTSEDLPPAGLTTKRYEIDLTLGWNSEDFRYGYRGTYWQVEICATDYTGQGRVEIDGVAVKYTPVRETHDWARPFTGELEVDVELETLSKFFFGTTTDDDTAGSIWLAEQGPSDFGEILRVWLQPNPTAPFGTSEEAWFRMLYLSFTRSNTEDVELAVTPILDNTELETTAIQLPAVTQPVTDVHEIPLSVPNVQGGIEVGRAGVRGVWFSYRVTNITARASGELMFNGAAIEAIPLRETEPGVT